MTTGTVPTGVAALAAASTSSVAASHATTSVKEVAVPSVRHAELEALRDLPRTLMAGTAAMRQAGEKYMPKHPAESGRSYDSRLNSTTLFGIFKETVIKMAGKMFAKPIVLKETVPEPIQKLAEDIDAQGRALTPFMFDVVVEAFVDGVSYFLVEYPTVTPGATQADVQSQGIRPYWVHVGAQSLIGVKTATINGAAALTQIRVREATYEDAGEFGQKLVQRVRVVEPNRVRVYELRKTTASEEWQLIKDIPTTQGKIMLVAVYVNRCGFYEGEPPLLPLAELCQEHWISSSENRNALTFARFAMLKIVGGNSQTTVEVGPNKIVNLPLGADAGYLEPTGGGISLGFQDLTEIQDRMQTAGATLRIESAGQVTATTSAIDSADTNSALKAIAKAVEDAVELGLQFTADLMSLPEGGEAEVYDEFAESPPPGDVPNLVQLRTTGNISRETLWQELQRRHILGEDFDPKAESKLLEDNAAADLNAMGGSMNLPPMPKPIEPTQPTTVQ